MYIPRRLWFWANHMAGTITCEPISANLASLFLPNQEEVFGTIGVYKALVRIVRSSVLTPKEVCSFVFPHLNYNNERRMNP